jgi:hypothetical protein
MLAFYVPLFVFLFNTTSSYKILRFNRDLLTWILISLGALSYFYLSVLDTKFEITHKIDVNTSNLKREKPSMIIIAVAFLSYSLMRGSPS